VIARENLEVAHFIEWGLEEYPHPSRFFGFVLRRDGELVAIALIWVDDNDRFWGNFAMRPGCPRSVHATTLDMFRRMDEAGVPAIWADCNYDIPRAEAWLLRLGFLPVDDEKKEWRRDLYSAGRRYRDIVQSLADGGEGIDRAGTGGAGLRHGRGQAA